MSDDKIKVWVAVDPFGKIILGTVFDAPDKVERFMGNRKNWQTEGWAVQPYTLTKGHNHE